METKQRCIYRMLDNGIHEFVFTESSKQAVDEFIAHLEVMASTLSTSTNAVTRTLMDTRQSGALPMYYTFKRYVEWRNRQSEENKNRPSRTAQLYNANTVYASIAQNLMKILQSSRLKQEYFLNDCEAAIVWLLADD